MYANILIAITTLTTASAAARTCTFELSHLRTQNPVGGGDNTLTCFARLDYGDGRPVDELSTRCYDIVRDGCYNSQLPNQVCVHTNQALEDGYLDYGSQHRDWNEDGCEKTGYASPAGDHQGVKCSFPCD